MALPNDIADYIEAQDANSKQLCQALTDVIGSVLSKAEGKVWHGHPVWFLAGNPIVGISRKKAGVELLFWSGQSFENSGLVAIGKYKAAGKLYESLEHLKITQVKSWLKESKTVQWDYANLPKKRKLEKLF